MAHGGVQAGGRLSRAQVEVKLIDSDVHPYLQSREELAPYVPEPWRTVEYSRRGYSTDTFPIMVSSSAETSMRKDAVPPTGATAGSDPDFVYDQLLHGMGVDFAILIPLGARMRADPEHEGAIASGLNEWLADTWLGKYNWHGRYRGSIRVCSEDPPAAVREIEKWAGHPNFVQVFIPPETPAPLGQPRYHPIYEAAAKHGLPVALHATAAVGARFQTPAGFPTYYYEYFATIPLVYMAHVASFVFNGTFEKYPDLKLVLVEGGFTWLAPLIWRLEKHWDDLRNEVPGLKRRPSEYVRDQVRLSTQPFEEPRESRHLRYVIEQLGGEHMLMFATDYPHHDADDPKWIAARLPKEYRDRILRDNALELYDLPRTRTEMATQRNKRRPVAAQHSGSSGGESEVIFDL